MTEISHILKFKTSRKRLFIVAVNLLLVFSFVLLGINLSRIIDQGGWANRESFFLEGEFAPTLIDFIFNEVILAFFLLYIIILKVKPLILRLMVIIFTASAFTYFSRAPIILLICALIFNSNFFIKHKVILGAILLLLSTGVMFLRLGDELFDFDNLSLFFFTYPFVGIARLIEAGISIDVNALHMISILLKPLDVCFFVIDYLYGLNGSLSASRFVGKDLTQFIYLPLLGDSFNAFGTVAYPFIFIFGWFLGPVLFVSFIIVMYCTYRFHFRQHAVALRVIMMIIISGFLFSWASPFIWILPFVFPKSILQNH